MGFIPTPTKMNEQQPVLDAQLFMSLCIIKTDAENKLESQALTTLRSNLDVCPRKKKITVFLE
jgi:hypothetical protein